MIIHRKTKQQERVIEIFKSLNHPSAQEVYKNVRKVYPTIGRATVYRVLNRLVDSGEVLQINREENCVFFDKNNFSHPHAYCVKCGKISDVYFDETFKNCHESLCSSLKEFTPLGVDFKIVGICKNCKKEQKV